MIEPLFKKARSYLESSILIVNSNICMVFSYFYRLLRVLPNDINIIETFIIISLSYSKI